MARLKLKTKKKEDDALVIKRSKMSALNDPGNIPSNHPDNFLLLTDNRCQDEKFSRVSRYITNHYFLIGTEWLCERLFYPSSYGMEEIESDPAHPYLKYLNRLKKEGIGLLGERPTPKIFKSIPRIKLKCKPKRLQLTAKG